MKQLKTSTLFRAAGMLLPAGILTSSLLVQSLMPLTAHAAPIIDRSLTLVGTGTGVSYVGGSTPGGIVDHKFDFTTQTSTNIQSIKIQYCDAAADPSGGTACSAPQGMDAMTAAYGTLTGLGAATGSVSTMGKSANSYIVNLSSAVPGNGNVSLTMKTIKNPQKTTPTPSDNYTFYARITTYTAVDGGGTAIDAGTVAASTAHQIQLQGTMPESLVFCTGKTIGTTGGIPDCSTATTGLIRFNQLFSSTDTAVATSQMAASTNAGSGYAITVNGPTLTSGSNVIAAMSALGLPAKGTAQFGMNLKANTTTAASSFPFTSANIAPVSNGTNLRGQPAAGYATQDQFKFASGDVVANSYNPTPGGSDAQIYTASYIANVPGSQPAGDYQTTLTYVCTPKF